MILQLETVSACNAACVFCEYSKANRPKLVMKEWLYKKIIDEAATIPHILLLTLNGLGETLLDPFMDERIQYAKEKIPVVRTLLFTNGLLLSPDRMDRLKRSGLDSIAISVNANTQAQHEKIMGVRGQFDTVVRNAKYAIDTMDMAWVHCVVGRHFTEQDADIFNKTWGCSAKCVKDCNLTKPKDPKESCWRAMNTIMVSVDGTVTPCVFDHGGRMPMGNVATQTLREVYNNDPYLSFRITHDRNQVDTIPMCRDCPRGGE